MKPIRLADAEADLAAALDSGDQVRIDAAGRLVDQLDPNQQPTVQARRRIVLDTALGYAALGLHVFPVDGKQPRVKWGEESTVDPGTITSWWSRWPDTGIGVDCGKSGLVVVDLDVKNGVNGVAEWKALNDGRAPATYYALTPSGGLHLYYRDPEGRYRNSAGQVAPGVDIRGVGGYVVAPGSPDYSWHAECPLALDDIPALPDGIIPISTGGGTGHWTKLDRAALDPRNLAALEALEALGGHSAYLSDGYVAVTRPGKVAGASASIGHIGPGIVKMFTPHWPRLRDGAVYDADDLAALIAGPATASSTTRLVQLVDAAGIVVRPVAWLWAERLAVGTVVLLAGREGIGKSTVGYQLAADLTKGTLPGIHFGTPRDVIVAATEDSWGHTIVPRLMAADADLKRIHKVDVLTPAGDEIPLVVPLDVVGLAARAVEVDAAMILFDPIISRLSDTLDTHIDAEVRRGLEPISAMADKLGVVVLGIIHVNKSGTSDPLNAVMASKAFTAVARAVLFCMHDPDSDDGVRLLGQPKNNLGRDDLPTLAFKIETAIATVVNAEPVYTGRIEWLGEVDKSIREALEDANDVTTKTLVGEAKMWLEDHLSERGGIAKSADIKKAGRALGHSERNLQRAGKKLRLAIESTGFPRETWWSIPGTQPSRDTSPRGDATVATVATEPESSSGDSRDSGDSPGGSGATDD